MDHGCERGPRGLGGVGVASRPRKTGALGLRIGGLVATAKCEADGANPRDSVLRADSDLRGLDTWVASFAAVLSETLSVYVLDGVDVEWGKEGEVSDRVMGLRGPLLVNPVLLRTLGSTICTLGLGGKGPNRGRGLSGEVDRRLLVSVPSCATDLLRRGAGSVWRLVADADALLLPKLLRILSESEPSDLRKPLLPRFTGISILGVSEILERASGDSELLFTSRCALDDVMDELLLALCTSTSSNPSGM